MPTRQEIKDKILKIAQASLPEFVGRDFKESDSINADGGIDSMTMTYIICSIEDDLGIDIPQKKWKKIATLGDLLDACEAELKKKA